MSDCRGFPHERLHQDRCGRRFRTQTQNHERLPWFPQDRAASRQRKGIWSQINETLRKKVRIAAGRNP
ncbi:MAG: hypothetical protein F6K52_19985 [Moorea sp. SIO3H5]|nr:hypothetical protein [Moorena sp. SIO3H5]